MASAAKGLPPAATYKLAREIRVLPVPHSATTAAERQERSNGLVPSGFDTWLAQRRARGEYRDYDPDEELHERF